MAIIGQGVCGICP